MPTVRWPCTLEWPRTGRDSRALAADVALQQQQVDQHRDVLEPVDVLGQAHAVDADDALRFDIDVGGGFDRGAR